MSEPAGRCFADHGPRARIAPKRGLRALGQRGVPRGSVRSDARSHNTKATRDHFLESLQGAAMRVGQLKSSPRPGPCSTNSTDRLRPVHNPACARTGIAKLTLGSPHNHLMSSCYRALLSISLSYGAPHRAHHLTSSRVETWQARDWLDVGRSPTTELGSVLVSTRWRFGSRSG